MPWSKLLVLGMGDLPPFNRNPYNGYINPYYWVDDHPLLYGNNGSLDPGTYPTLGKRKIIDSKVPAGSGYVGSQEGIYIFLVDG